MLVFALLLLLNATEPSVRTQLIHEGPVEVWPGKFRTMEMPEATPGARLTATFRVVTGEAQARVFLLRYAGGDRLLKKENLQFLEQTEFLETGRLSHILDGKPTVLVLDSTAPTTVMLKVQLMTSRHPVLQTVTPWRAAWLLYGSLGIFFVLAAWAGTGLKRALDNRPEI